MRNPSVATAGPASAQTPFCGRSALSRDSQLGGLRAAGRRKNLGSARATATATARQSQTSQTDRTDRGGAQKERNGAALSFKKKRSRVKSARGNEQEKVREISYEHESERCDFYDRAARALDGRPAPAAERRKTTNDQPADGAGK